MKKYIFAVIKDALYDEPGIIVFISNKKYFEKTHYSSDHDYWPTCDIKLEIELEELQEGVFLVEDEKLTVKQVIDALSKCEQFEESKSFKAFIKSKIKD